MPRKSRKVRVPTRSSRVHTKNFRKLGKNTKTGLSVPSKATTTNPHLKVSSKNPFVGSFG